MIIANYSCSPYMRASITVLNNLYLGQRPQQKVIMSLLSGTRTLHQPLSLKTSYIAAPIFAGDSTTVTPASFNARILSCAVPFPPAIIAANCKRESYIHEV
mgnify:CR=1 FL=1